MWRGVDEVLCSIATVSQHNTSWPASEAGHILGAGQRAKPCLTTDPRGSLVALTRVQLIVNPFLCGCEMDI